MWINISWIWFFVKKWDGYMYDKHWLSVCYYYETYFIPFNSPPPQKKKINVYWTFLHVESGIFCELPYMYDLKNSWKWMVEPTVKANVICITANIKFLSICHCFPLDSVVTCFAEVRALNRPPQEDLNFCIIPRGTGHDAVYVLLQKQYQRLQESNCTGICQRSFMW